MLILLDVCRIFLILFIVEKIFFVGWIVGFVFVLGSDEDCVFLLDMVFGDCVVLLVLSLVEVFFGFLFFN